MSDENKLELFPTDKEQIGSYELAQEKEYDKDEYINQIKKSFIHLDKY